MDVNRGVYAIYSSILHMLWCRFNQWYQFFGLTNLVASKSKLHTNCICLSFECPRSNILIHIIEDNDIRYSLSFVTSMSSNTKQMFVVNHVMKSGVNRFTNKYVQVAIGHWTPKITNDVLYYIWHWIGFLVMMGMYMRVILGINRHGKRVMSCRVKTLNGLRGLNLTQSI